MLVGPALPRTQWSFWPQYLSSMNEECNESVLKEENVIVGCSIIVLAICKAYLYMSVSTHFLTWDIWLAETKIRHYFSKETELEKLFTIS